MVDGGNEKPHPLDCMHWNQSPGGRLVNERLNSEANCKKVRLVVVGGLDKMSAGCLTKLICNQRGVVEGGAELEELHWRTPPLVSPMRAACLVHVNITGGHNYFFGAI